MAAIRAMTVERLAVPAALGKLVGNVKSTWPLLVFGPILFWLVLLFATTGLGQVPVHHHLQPSTTMGQFFYDQYVPHYLIYAVYFSATAWILIALGSSSLKFWRLLGAGAERKGSFLGSLIGTFVEIATHGKFSKCERGVPKRRWGHFMVMWGFVGAAITSGFAVVYLYGDTPLFSWFFKILPFETPGYPVPISHWVKWLGNLSAIALVLGGALLLVNRLSSGDKLVGATTAFDRFFLWLVLAVIGSGVLTEVLRFTPGTGPMLALSIYIIHLGVVLCLFLTLPYSKFAHFVYRTLAITHQKMVDAE
jgi:quinone-modifying oxidoreductase subunit QmoC